MIKLDFDPIIGKPIQGLELLDIAKRFGMDLIGKNEEVHFLNPLSVPKESRTKVLTYVTSSVFLKKFHAGDLDFAIIPRSLAHEVMLADRTYLSTDKNPRDMFTEIHLFLLDTGYYYKVPDYRGESNWISPRASIHPNVQIGNHCRIDDFAVIYPNTIIGDDVIIKAAAIIGGDGFQVEIISGRRRIVPHAGGVVLDDNVEIGSLNTIDKGMRSAFTFIGEDTKINNSVNIGHCVVIGKRCLIGLSAIVTGSAIIGDDVWIGPSACISSEVVVGNRALITIGSVVTKDVAPGQRVTGNFAIDHEKFINFMRKIR